MSIFDSNPAGSVSSIATCQCLYSNTDSSTFVLAVNVTCLGSSNHASGSFKTIANSGGPSNCLP